MGISIYILAILYWGVSLFYLGCGVLFALKVPFMVEKLTKTSPLISSFGWSRNMILFALFAVGITVGISGFGLWCNLWWAWGIAVFVSIFEVWLGCTFYVGRDIKKYNELSEEDQKEYTSFSYRNEFFDTIVHIGIHACIFGLLLYHLDLFYSVMHWWF
jgi:hypothetical protein